MSGSSGIMSKERGPEVGYPEAGNESRVLTLLNKYGMHVRPAGLFAKVASRFNAEVFVEKDGNVVSGKSIMALMTLEATCGSKLRVLANGPQAREALDELVALVARKFDIPDEQ